VLCFHEFAKKIKKSVAVLISAVIGCLALVGVGAAANYFVAPLYFKYFVGQIITDEFLIGYLSYACIINVVKGIVLSVVAYPVIFMLVDKLKKVSKL
jgi:riboflavin transporter FmnP